MIQHDLCCPEQNFDKREDMRRARQLQLYLHVLNKYNPSYTFQSYSVNSTNKWVKISLFSANLFFFFKNGISEKSEVLKKSKPYTVTVPDYSVFMSFIKNRSNPESIYFYGTQSDCNIIIIGRSWITFCFDIHSIT